ncbi:cucumisin-like [Senna tora]|uniref:Cucumisin-like n=1 Tax=Senna tora TaxID=362788 RepID=A0A834WPD0_9FABA|nr:cucumisin-like [Senna tora]
MQTYIVYMGDHPKGTRVTKLHHMSMVQKVLGRNFAPEALLHSYKKSFNGFVARLTEDEAERMAGYSTKWLRSLTDDNSRCSNTQSETVWDFNLPSFALYRDVSGSFSSSFHRTVTNVGAAKSTYKARVIAPPSLSNIQVTPNVVSFSSLGEKKSFTLTIKGRIDGERASASLIWDDGTFQVRTPIVVYGP